MPSNDKEPQEHLIDKIRSLFSQQDPRKKKDGLPPKAHFSIWYFLIAFLLIIYLQQYFFSPKGGDDSLQPVQTKRGRGHRG